jgi:hypothetical protein
LIDDCATKRESSIEKEHGIFVNLEIRSTPPAWRPLHPPSDANPK